MTAPGRSRNSPAEATADPAAGLTVRMLGGLRIIGPDGRDVTVSSRKALALLAYLAASRTRMTSRDTLADLLWSDSDDHHARTSLRQTLSILRRSLSPLRIDPIESTPDRIGLSVGQVEVDLAVFERAAAGSNLADAKKAVEIYRGGFLEGFHSGSGQFENWAAERRRQVIESAILVFDRVARASPGEPGILHAKQLLELDPLREASHRLIMELYLAAGQRDRGLRHFDQCAALFKRELGVSLENETLRIREMLRSGSPGVPATTSSPATVPAAVPHDPVRRKTIRVRLFDFPSQDPDLDGMARALHSEITTALSMNSEIVVLDEGRRAASSPMDGLPVGEAASPQSSFAIGGVIQKEGDRIRFHARLIEVASGRQVWAERFEGLRANWFDLVDQATRCIALTVNVELTYLSWNVQDLVLDQNPDVRFLVRTAIARYLKGTPDSLAEGIAICEEALNIDPASIRGKRTLAFCIMSATAVGKLERTPERLNRALALSEDAVAGARNDVLSRLAHAWALSTVGRHEQSAAELEFAIRLNPDYHMLHADLVEQYALLGRADLARRALGRSNRPTSPDPMDYWRHMGAGLLLFIERDFAGALEEARTMLALKPDFIRAHLLRAACSAALEDMENARASISVCLARRPDLAIENFHVKVMPRFVMDQDHLFLHRCLRLLACH